MLKFILYPFLILCSQYLVAQSLNVTGKIISSTNEPMMYANISIKGYPIGISSNEAGEFSFYFSDNYINDTLSVSAVGYET